MDAETQETDDLRGPGSVGEFVLPLIGCGFFTLVKSRYRPKSAFSLCPGASWNSDGGITVVSVEITLAGLYPPSSRLPLREPDAEGGLGTITAAVGEPPGSDSYLSTGAGRPITTDNRAEVNIARAKVICCLIFAVYAWKI